MLITLKEKRRLYLKKYYRDNKKRFKTYSSKYYKDNRERFSIYNAWTKMKIRCLDPNHYNYRNYGGRGIKVCKRWLNSFPNFLKDMGAKPHKEYELDRINVNRNYTPKNCRWTDKLTQMRNKRK